MTKFIYEFIYKMTASVKDEIISNLDKLDDTKLEQINDIIKSYINSNTSGKTRTKYVTDEEKRIMKLEQNRKSYWKNRTPEALEKKRIAEYNRRRVIKTETDVG